MAQVLRFVAERVNSGRGVCGEMSVYEMSVYEKEGGQSHVFVCMASQGSLSRGLYQGGVGGPPPQPKGSPGHVSLASCLTVCCISGVNGFFAVTVLTVVFINGNTYVNCLYK